MLAMVACCGIMVAQNAAAQNSQTIWNTVVIVSSERDCPAGYTIFHPEKGAKFPADAKICFVKSQQPPSNSAK